MEIAQDFDADKDGNCLVARLDMTKDGQTLNWRRQNAKTRIISFAK